MDLKQNHALPDHDIVLAMNNWYCGNNLVVYIMGGGVEEGSK